MIRIVWSGPIGCGSAWSTSPGSAGSLPFAPAYLTKFEALYCYDRFWNENGEPDGLATRMICSGHAFGMVGSDATPFYTDAETGLLGQFRHQYFLLGLIAHFQRAALLMLSDRLVVAISRLDIANIDLVKHFKRDIRQLQEIFLRFTHRYWFHEVSNREPARDLFRLWTDHLSMGLALRRGARGGSGYEPLSRQRRFAASG